VIAPREAPIPAAVFASGGGSTLGALLEHVAESRPGWSVAVVVSDREGAGALERARGAGVPAAVVPVQRRDPEEVAAESSALLGRHGVRFILLAGYLRLVPGGLVREFRGRILNVHPALLPAFGGKGMWGRHVHEAVLGSGVRITGPTVHLVDEEYDRGPILAQWPVPVPSGVDAAGLAARVQEVERALYPLVADHLARAVGAGRECLPPPLHDFQFNGPPGTSGEGLAGRIRAAHGEE